MNNLIIESDIKDLLARLSLDEMCGQTVLITGASGLIGTYLVYSIAIYNECYSKEKKISLSIVIQNRMPEHLIQFENAEWLTIYQGDLSEYEFCIKLPNADYIIHAAGYGQPGKFMDSKVKTIKLNTICTGILLEKLNSSGKFLFISTSEVYNDSPNIPYNEKENGTTMPDHARACYIEGKRCGEALCNIYADKGYHVKIARVALAYGPGIRKDDKRVLYNFIQKAFKEGCIKMLDSGKAKRVYCYIADTIEVLWRILFTGKSVTYNVGGESYTTILNLANIIGQILDVDVIYPEEEKQQLSGAPNEVFMDIVKMKEEFNKYNFISLEDGIARTVRWYRENLI